MKKLFTYAAIALTSLSFANSSTQDVDTRLSNIARSVQYTKWYGSDEDLMEAQEILNKYGLASKVDACLKNPPSFFSRPLVHYYAMQALFFSVVTLAIGGFVFLACEGESHQAPQENPMIENYQRHGAITDRRVDEMIIHTIIGGYGVLYPMILLMAQNASMISFAIRAKQPERTFTQGGRTTTIEASQPSLRFEKEVEKLAKALGTTPTSPSATDKSLILEKRLKEIGDSVQCTQCYGTQADQKEVQEILKKYNLTQKVDAHLKNRSFWDHPSTSYYRTKAINVGFTLLSYSITAFTCLKTYTLSEKIISILPFAGFSWFMHYALNNIYIKERWIKTRLPNILKGTGDPRMIRSFQYQYEQTCLFEKKVQQFAKDFGTH